MTRPIAATDEERGIMSAFALFATLPVLLVAGNVLAQAMRRRWYVVAALAAVHVTVRALLHAGY